LNNGKSGIDPARRQRQRRDTCVSKSVPQLSLTRPARVSLRANSTSTLHSPWGLQVIDVLESRIGGGVGQLPCVRQSGALTDCISFTTTRDCFPWRILLVHDTSLKHLPYTLQHPTTNLATPTTHPLAQQPRLSALLLLLVHLLYTLQPIHP
jgi:hypothetical protein